MAKRRTSYSPAAMEAVQVLGAQIGIARREAGWTAADLAGRLGVTPALVTRIERGAPGTSIGTVLEAATICGVRLFGVDERDLPEVRARVEKRLLLLPQRVRPRAIEISDDF